MEFLTVKEALESIDLLTNIDVKNNKEKVFLYLTMAQNRAWREGSYKGFLRDFDVKTYTDNGRRFIKTPHGYNVLMGININSKPIIIRDSYFQYHHNGRASLTCDGMFPINDETMYFRESPTIINHSLLAQDKRFKIAVASTTIEKDDAEILISGLDYNGNPVYSYSDKEDEYLSFEEYQEHENEKNVDIGVRVNLGTSLKIIENVRWSSITSITKSVTNGVVSVYIIDDCDKIKEVARIEPHQKVSKYRIYQIPEEIECKCSKDVHCLFKISEPDPIVSENQRLIIDDIESIVTLVKSFDNTFDKDELEKGELMLNKGMLGLNSDNERSKPPTIKPIQFIGLDGEVDNDELPYT